MSAIILDGKKTRDEAIPELAKRVTELSFVPSLVIIQVGERADSTSFIKSKKSFAEKIGVNTKHIQVPENIKQDELVDIIKKNNEDASVNGIIVQLPLPSEIDRDVVIDTILPNKDVDALTAHNVKRWLDGNENAIMPATARGIRELLRKYKIGLSGKKVVVVGRSTLVGKPITAMCLDENATVTVCHSKTPDLAKETQSADVVIVAVGKQGLIKAEHVKAGQIIIDVGINTVEGKKLDDEIPNKKLYGDVDFENVVGKVSAITPVPGGVGPMTVLSLFENLLDLCKKV
ncbi:MAG: bifunctional 5,10-methylenetetrahydrofolate dehydrogenase/5,10-methenyltetrahydrofolate cyclohydrolase [Candidatus Paceibacterota bacterium]|jgi:methylenetetrahydrofolate dehydrogenase (NADP+)/methenyltetrahydrofolate cyclohydrolase